MSSVPSRLRFQLHGMCRCPNSPHGFRCLFVRGMFVISSASLCLQFRRHGSLDSNPHLGAHEGAGLSTATPKVFPLDGWRAADPLRPVPAGEWRQCGRRRRRCPSVGGDMVAQKALRACNIDDMVTDNTPRSSPSPATCPGVAAPRVVHYSWRFITRGATANCAHDGRRLNAIRRQEEVEEVGFQGKCRVRFSFHKAAVNYPTWWGRRSAFSDPVLKVWVGSIC